MARRTQAGDRCPVCEPGRVRQDPDGFLSCSNCLWNSEEDGPGEQAHDQWCVDRHDEAGKCLNVYQPGREQALCSRCGSTGPADWCSWCDAGADRMPRRDEVTSREQASPEARIALALSCLVPVYQLAAQAEVRRRWWRRPDGPSIGTLILAERVRRALTGV